MLQIFQSLAEYYLHQTVILDFSIVVTEALKFKTKYFAM